MNIDKTAIQRRLDEALARIDAQLLWVADALIPEDAQQGMPSATQAGVHTLLLPRALRARDDLIEPFAAALERLPRIAPANPIEAIRALGDAPFDLISHLIAGAYFLDLDINRRLRYPGQEEMSYEPDYDEIMEVVQRVIDRGPVYVDPATGQRALAAEPPRDAG